MWRSRFKRIEQSTAEDALDLLSQKFFDRIAQSTVVSIANIQGPAVAGGFELTLACDLRVSAPKPWFALPEVSKGLIPAAGGCTRLTHLLGTSVAKGVILGSEQISAEQAHSWGLVQRLSDKPRKEAMAWLKLFSQKIPWRSNWLNKSLKHQH